MSKIVGFDLGTNSIGTAIRNTRLGENLNEQLEYYSVDIFDSGVGNKKGNEYSYAAERSKGVRQRRLYDVRRRRRWETLKYLIAEPGYCPLTPTELEEWMIYDKSKGLTRKYPIDNKEFMSWIRMDFDGDGVSDCTPYELRYQLVHRQFDFSDITERYRFGRAIFHICQHRGFRSSKGETLADQEVDDNADISTELKKSEQKKSGKLTSYMKEHSCKTAGEALYLLNKEGDRIRNSEYLVVRSLLKDEIKEIFAYQNGLDIDSDLYLHLTSEKKHEGCIFFKNPLRTQKGLVGKCTFEPSKRRAPISHPDYEKYRALCFIANIRIRANVNDEWHPLSPEIKHKIYQRCFISRVGSDFDFKRIREELERLTGTSYTYESNKHGTINYKDHQSVVGCPVIGRLVQLLGDDWENVRMEGTKERNRHSKTAPTRHTVSYGAEDIWHVCFTADEKEDVEHFASNSLQWDDEKVANLVRMWGKIKQGYGMLSLKAIRNINRMLEYGLDNADAVFMAKIPEVVGLHRWKANINDVQSIIKTYLTEIKEKQKCDRLICTAVNTLIANYKSLPEQHVFAYKDVSYQLQESDLQDVDAAIVDVVGKHTWELMNSEEQEPIISKVREKYQEFFASSKREFCKVKRLADYLSDYLCEKEGFDAEKLSKLYHPSMSEFPAPNHGNQDRSDWKLGCPKMGGIRNPVALRTLHVLRRKVNTMLKEHMIDPETTRIVIETTRDINDANMRWAIAQYQKKREEENTVIEDLLKEFFPEGNISESDYDKANSFMMQKKKKDADEIDDEYAYEDNRMFPFTGVKDKVDKDRKSLIKKYKLWKEQGGICLYTGAVINFCDLFGGGGYDIEHTLPRSKSFDDSQANLTVCEQHYNRAIKGNKIPCELPNYKEDAIIGGKRYTAILPRLEAWEKRVEKLQDNVNFWKAQARKAQDKGRKDDCIRQRHLWQMELDYWKDKLSRFKMKEIPQGFRHRQIADTGIISRYAVLYLKTVFQHVEVQKGEVTASFRKVLGLQSMEEKKDRSLHSHHAIDATMLTLIPAAAKRENILKLFYEREEAVEGTTEYNRINRALSVELQSCNLGSSPESIADTINKSILVNIISKEKTLIPSCRNVRSRGKLVQYKDASGELTEKKSKGDSIRGSLHKDSIYGAIVYPKTDKEGMPVVESGKFSYDDYTPRMVVRVDIRKFNKIEDFDNIVDFTLRKRLKEEMARRLKEGKSFSAALAEGLWQIDKAGREVKHGKSPIRHVRCFVKAGRGFLTYDKSLQIKAQTHLSEKSLLHLPNREHKSYVSVVNDENCLMLLYACVSKGNIKRAARILNPFEVAKIKAISPTISRLADISKESYYSTLQKRKDTYELYATLQPGTRVLKWENNIEELREMTEGELSKRLFYVKNFNNVGTNELPKYRIHVQSHMDAMENTISYAPQDFKFLIEGVDFNMDMLGKISFVD